MNYQSGNTNVDAHALSHIPGEEHNQHIDADSVHVLISHVVQGSTLIEAYFCNIQITKTLDMQLNPKSHAFKGLDHGPNQDPAIREIKYLISKNKLRGHKVYLQDPQIMKQ